MFEVETDLGRDVGDVRRVEGNHGRVVVAEEQAAQSFLRRRERIHGAAVVLTERALRHKKHKRSNRHQHFVAMHATDWLSSASALCLISADY